MFVGETGVSRIVEKTCEAMKAAGITDPHDVARIRALGVIDLPLIQRKLNLHYSLTLDLFGNEISTNAANAFNSGLKGRYREDKLADDHQLLDDTYAVLRCVEGRLVEERVPALSALNMRLRDDYIADAAGGVNRWNKVIEKIGIDFRLTLPHQAHNRHIGEFSALKVDPDGHVLSEAAWAAGKDGFLPTAGDAEFIAALMQPVHGIGEYASWIAAPKLGIDSKPGDFEYVKIHE
jgi:benzoyl-CoA 2,3-dioxygenase component B